MIGKRVMALILILFFLSTNAPLTAAEKEEIMVQDEVMYSIMIDRFNNGDPKNDQDIDINNPAGYYGGDIKGIIAKLDYIQDMGFTAILLSPLFKSNSYDGSGVQDFYKVDEHYGTLEQLEQLIQEAHDRNMKVMLSFPTVADEKEMLRAAMWWMDEIDIDGYKLSNLEKLPISFWQRFSQKVKLDAEEFYLIGSISKGNEGILSEDVGFDLIIGHSLQEQVSEVFSGINSSQRALYEQWEQTGPYSQNLSAIGTVIDDESTVRFTRKAVENRYHPGTKIKLALIYLFSTPTTPIVYYGTEIALNGGEAPTNNQLMDFRAGKELIDYISKVNEIRKRMPSLRKGDFKLIYEKNGMTIYKRQYNGETAVVAINNTDETKIVDVSINEFGKEKELRGLLEEDIIRPTKDGYRIALDREKANLYLLGEQTGLNVKFIAAMVIVYGAFMVFLYLVWKRRKVKRA